MKESVYIETSVVSYLVSRPSRDIIVAGHQQITYDWWKSSLTRFEIYISEIVIIESSQGDPDVSAKRLKELENFKILEIVPEVEDLGNLYLDKLRLPDKAKADAYHLAIATLHGMDYLISWNCRHIVNAVLRRIIENVNAELGYITPVICTPEELVE